VEEDHIMCETRDAPLAATERPLLFENIVGKPRLFKGKESYKINVPGLQFLLF
jgi:hypothetical protein